MILVTGANGNVGGELIIRLAAANHAVRALVRTQKGTALPSSVEAVVGDLDQPDSLSRALEGVNGVFLLGGYLSLIHI